MTSSCTKRDTPPLRMSFNLKEIITDPHHMEDIYSMIVCNQLYASLLQYLPDGSLVPDIASHWKISNDNLNYHFYLNERKFSNQKKITATDVEKSLKRIFVEGASISADLQNIKGYAEFLKTKDAHVLGIKALSENELEIQLSKPNAVLLKQLATPDTAILSLDDRLHFTLPMVYSGSYILSSKNADSLTLSFWEKNLSTSKVPPPKVIFHLKKDSDLIQEALNDQSDFANVSSTNPLAVKKLKDLSFHEALGGMTHEYFMVINPQHVPSEWRDYLFKHFNSEEFLSYLPFPNKEAAYGFVPNVLKGAIKTPLFDSSSIVLNEEKLKPFTLKIHFIKTPIVEFFSSYIKKIWNHPHLTLQLIEHDTDSYLQLLKDKTFESTFSAKGLDYPDAMANLSYFKSDIRDNYFCVHDRNVDQLIYECAASDSKEDSCFVKLQKEIISKKTVLPLFFGTDKLELWSKNVSLVPPHPLGIQFLKFDQIEMVKK